MLNGRQPREPLADYHQLEYFPHTFRTTTTAERFNAIVARACKSKLWIGCEGLDRCYVPFTRLFAVTFTSIEDRDRVRIAMRFVDLGAPAVPAHLARA